MRNFLFFWSLISISVTAMGSTSPKFLGKINIRPVPDINIASSRASDELLVPPEGLETEPWVLAWDGGMFDDASALWVKLGCTSEEVWLQGICTSFPDSWAKATLENDTVTFSGTTFLGEYYDIPIVLTQLSINYDEEDYYFVGEMKFVLDRENKTINPVTPNTCLIANINDLDEIMYLSCYENGRFIYQADTNPDVQQQAPLIVAYEPYSASEGSGAVGFTMPMQCIDGQYLDPQNYYWEFYVNGEPYVFRPNQWEGITEPITQVPYALSMGENLLADNSYHEFYFFETSPDVALRTVYYSGDNVYYSPVVYFDGREDGIQEIDSSKDNAKDYYDLTGRKTVNPGHGIFIMKKGNKALKIVR